MKYVMYPHGGSDNHGCEAIVRATVKLLGKDATLYSNRPIQDTQVGLNKICHIEKDILPIKKGSMAHLNALLKAKVLRHHNAFDEASFRQIIKGARTADYFLSIGGDNYCYGHNNYIYLVNQVVDRIGIPRILWGASVEPADIDERMLIDLKGYAKIWARESLTYEALLSKGLRQTFLLPDPAFQLERVDLELPDGFIEGNTVGINLSPMVMNCENGDNITFKNYEKLIEHIIATSDMQIALIPHVVWAENDDRVPLRLLYEKYKNTGRVVMIEDHNCMELKGYIARCRFMIAARTHASIAAYSTCVPTLVVGYSVKAKGIAKDIFGTYENYVLPVQSLSQEEDLTNAFDWIYQREDQIRTHLQSMMPEYRDRALLIGEELKKIM